MTQQEIMLDPFSMVHGIAITMVIIENNTCDLTEMPVMVNVYGTTAHVDGSLNMELGSLVTRIYIIIFFFQTTPMPRGQHVRFLNMA